MEQEEYDFDKNYFEIAKERGLIVRLPESNELQIDIDSEDQYQEFVRRIYAIRENFEYREFISSSGLPKRHIYIRFQDRQFTDEERLAYQAMLNDDPLRIFLNGLRLIKRIENPSRLFEKPDFDFDKYYRKY